MGRIPAATLSPGGAEGARMLRMDLIWSFARLPRLTARYNVASSVIVRNGDSTGALIPGGAFQPGARAAASFWKASSSWIDWRNSVAGFSAELGTRSSNFLDG